MPFNWTCPYCERDTTITDTQIAFSQTSSLESADGYFVFAGQFIACPNPKCTRVTLIASLFRGMKRPNKVGPSSIEPIGNKIKDWQLVPPSSGRQFPDYVPAPLPRSLLDSR